MSASNLIKTIRSGSESRATGKHSTRGWIIAFFALLTLPLVALPLIPGSLEGKSLAVLHGLCAQQPTHSIYFGAQRLPFDARMTGIYGGAAVTALVLLGLGRWRAGGLPSIGALLMIVLGIFAMGFDGVNSTLADVGVWSLYEPDNRLRLATGLLTGLTLATFIWMLVGQVAFRPDERSRTPVWRSGWELLIVYAALAGFGVLVSAGIGALRIPLTYLLILAAVLVLTSLMAVFALLISRAEGRAQSLVELGPQMTVGLLAAFVMMGALAGGRFLLEIWAGIQTTT